MSRSEHLLLGAVLVIVGTLGLVAGVIYLTVAAKSLPSVLGTLHGLTGHRTKRGIVALAVGGVLGLGGLVVLMRAARLAR